MAEKPVFVSFDFDNDRALKDFIIGQSKLADSPFEVVDNSLKRGSAGEGTGSTRRAPPSRAQRCS